jgi:hypothetical protein
MVGQTTFVANLYSILPAQLKVDNDEAKLIKLKLIKFKSKNNSNSR